MKNLYNLILRNKPVIFIFQNAIWSQYSRENDLKNNNSKSTIKN